MSSTLALFAHLSTLRTPYAVQNDIKSYYCVAGGGLQMPDYFRSKLSTGCAGHPGAGPWPAKTYNFPASEAPDALFIDLGATCQDSTIERTALVQSRLSHAHTCYYDCILMVSCDDADSMQVQTTLRAPSFQELRVETSLSSCALHRRHLLS